jgi:hypothetical protein
MNKGKGFSILSMLIVMGFISLLALSVADFNRKIQLSRPVEKFSLRLLDIRTMMHAWNQANYTAGKSIHDRDIWPNRLQDFEGFYVASCSNQDASDGLCTPIDHTPWGSMTYSVDTYITPTGFRSYYGKLVFSVPDEGDDLFKTQYNAMHEYLSPISGMTWDKVNNTMTYRIDNADLAFSFDGLVKRSGDDSELLGDWDLGGNFGPLNARDYLIKDKNSNHQISVARGLITVENISHGDTIPKILCAQGLSPNLTLNVGEIIPQGGDYSGIHSFKPYVRSETSKEWNVSIDMIVDNLKTGKSELIHDGKATALIQCS